MPGIYQEVSTLANIESASSVMIFNQHTHTRNTHTTLGMYQDHLSSYYTLAYYTPLHCAVHIVHHLLVQCLEYLRLIGDYQRLLEIVRDYYRLLEITGDY